MINFAGKLVLDFEKDSDLRISSICRAITGLNLVVILLNFMHFFKLMPLCIRLLLFQLSYY